MKQEERMTDFNLPRMHKEMNAITRQIAGTEHGETF